MSISKKIRFEVFKRDHFRCCYCGSAPPSVIFVRKVENRIRRDIEEVAEVYADNYPGWGLTDQFKNVSIKRFLSRLPKHVVIDAFRNAMSICGKDKNGAVKYFCGTCWGKIRDLQEQ